MTSKSGKITQYRRVYDRLMAGETIDQIRKDISGGSALHRGIQMYLERMQGDIPELQRESARLYYMDLSKHSYGFKEGLRKPVD